MTPKAKKAELAPSITLSELTERYVKHMEGAGKTRGTVFSYESELKLAQRELGADIRIGALTRDDITVFNNCARVTLLKSGRAKSQLSVDKSRRVLRLALKWAEDEKLIATSPAEPLATEPPSEQAKARAKKADETETTDATPAPKKPRKRKQAITLEVSQVEAEAAADTAEAQIAATSDETAV